MAEQPQQAIRMETADTTPIQNWQDLFIGNPAWALRLEGDIKFPQILRARTHPRFNCHGLTFGSRRASIWPSEVDTILKEDGYQLIEDKARVLPGDCIIYYGEEGEAEHSGIVVRNDPPLYEPIVVSKWGPAGPEVIHPARQGHRSYPITGLRFYRIMP